MARNPKYYEKLSFNNSYHIYNRTNNKEDLFINDAMRFMFIRRLKSYLDGYFTIHAFCLLRNHFHLLVSSKKSFQILKHLEEKDKSKLLSLESDFIKMPDNERVENAHKLLNLQFIRLFTSYSISFNKMFSRSGNLFHRPYKRKLVGNNDYFKTIVLYIHKNPLKHNLDESYDTYYWSSYQEYISKDEYISDHKKIIYLFKSLDAFVKAHENEIDVKGIYDLLLED